VAQNRQLNKLSRQLFAGGPAYGAGGQRRKRGDIKARQARMGALSATKDLKTTECFNGVVESLKNKIL
jgi:hypothetical protein